MSEICINPQCLVDDAPWLGDTKHGDDAFSYKETGNPPLPPNQKYPSKSSVSGQIAPSNLCIDS